MDVTIAQGTYRGDESDGIASFKGIPYAAAPTGARRFAAPEPPEVETGPVDATEYGATVSTPPQRSAVMDALLPDPVRPGRNGLNLNIWTPDTTGRLPVLVFIHGGGFATGAGSTTAFDGTAFARDGVVAVTVNYRLAVEGFLAIPGVVDNRGLLDQIAALQWIADNIAAFGGDPSRVTVAGESAGAMSVLTLITMPRAKGLITRAVSQSGDGHHVHTPGMAAIVTAEMSSELGVDITVEALEQVPVDVLHKATNAVLSRLTGSTDPRFAEFRRLVMQPVVDGDTLPEHPVSAAARGAGSDVDLLVGTNAQEYGLFVAPTGMGGMSEEVLIATVARLGVDAPAMIETYRAHLPGATPAELFVAIQSDWFCVVPTVRYAEARAAAGSPTHVYQFAWQPPTYDGALGACHTLEIPFVFSTLDDPWGKELRGDPTPESQAVSQEMHAVWVAFATTGDPGWPGYGTDRTVKRFDVQSSLVDDPDAFRRQAWDGMI